MLRFVELALLLAPVAAFVAWRLAASADGPSPRVIATCGVLLVLLFIALVWLRHEGTVPPDAEYVPPQLQDGRIVPAHGEKR